MFFSPFFKFLGYAIMILLASWFVNTFLTSFLVFYLDDTR
nr:MAG TPA: hypothetical protein [Caudoviricetes sp.]